MAAASRAERGNIRPPDRGCGVLTHPTLYDACPEPPLTNSTLYRGDGRFYLVPDDHDLAEGTLVLTSLDGATRSADAAGCAPFQVTEAIAKAHTRAALASLASGLADLTHSVGKGVSALDPSTPQAGAPLLGVEATLADLTKRLANADLTNVDDYRQIRGRVEALDRLGDAARLEAVLGEAQQSLSELLGDLEEE